MAIDATEYPAGDPRVFTAGTTQANEALKLSLAESLDFIASLELDDMVKVSQGNRIVKRGTALLAELRGEGYRNG